MEQRSLGSTGLRVSALGFGAGAVGGLFVRGDPADQRRALGRALEAGITYFDTAPSYGDGRSEENLGRALREVGTSHRVVVGTKVRLRPADLRDPQEAIVRSLEASLKRLGRDAVDLLQLHNPIVAATASSAGATASGGPVDVEDVLGPVGDGLRHVVQRGLARHVGITGLGDPATLLGIVAAGTFATVQTYFNVLNPSAGFAGASGGGQDFAGLIDVASRAGRGVIAIRVMAAGALSAAPQRHANAGDPGGPLVAGGDYTRDLERAETFAALAREWHLDGPLEIALRFAAAKPGVSTALVGYSEFAHLEAAIRWVERGPLPEVLTRRVVQLAG